MRIHRINPALQERDRISAEAAKQLAAHKERRYIRNLVIWWLVIGLTLAGLALWAQPAHAVEPWQLVESRYCAGTVCKDRWEQKVYDYAPVRVTLP